LNGQDTVIGIIGFAGIDWKNKNAEIGYWLGKPFWGRGLMTEAVKLILDYGFNGLKFHRVHSATFDDNKASQKVLKKSGLRFEGRFRQHNFKRGKWHDRMCFGLLASDYRKAK
jgi:RimJ/RimL family protein N-acetyltransferase